MITKERKKRNHPELQQQKKVIEFLRIQEEYGHVITYTATAQETFTGWAGIKMNQAKGVRRGLPDLIVVLPPDHNNATSPSSNRLVFIEMKAPGLSDSAVKPEQRVWIMELNKVASTVVAVVCFTAAHAIEILRELIGDTSCPKSDETFEEFLNQKQ